MARTASSEPLAPGARVEIRDEEWMVRTTKHALPGGRAVHATGMSELVRGKDAIFLSDLDEIKVLRPEETSLVHDDSPRYRKSRLYLEALLRRTPPTDTDATIYIGHRAAINRTDYQLQPAAKALRQPRPRILMADGVGLGKTIEVGILLSELIKRGRGERILVVALKSVLTQLQEEFWARFTIPLVRLDSVGIQRVQSVIPSNMNPFYFYDRVIISVDTLKRDQKYRRYLEECHWDAIVIDECQHVAVRAKVGGLQESQRARLARLLSRTSDALIMTSATPHDGRPQSFASLMRLLEPTAVADDENYTSEEVEDLFLRRFKKDIAHEVRDAFKERETALEKLDASARENDALECLSKIEFRTIARKLGSVKGGRGILFRTLLLKAFLSSPAACSSTIEKRLNHKALEVDHPDTAHDRRVLGELKQLVDAITPEEFQKYVALRRKLADLGVGKRNNDERVVVFSERIDTIKYLAERLKKDLKLRADQVEVFHGTLDDVRQQGLVKSFGTESSPIRLLICSDVASEGINLHFYCHRMVHFDLPWSLITLEQRNGRIDRYGQTNKPLIDYLLTIPADPKLKGDLRVLERLIEKEEHAHKNLGDVAWLLALHEAEAEEDHIARGIETGEPAEEVIPDDPEHTDFMAMLFGQDVPKEATPDVREQPLSLFLDDLTYAREAFGEILADDSDGIEWHDHLDGFTLSPPDDLALRYKYMPRELQTKSGELKLTTSAAYVMQSYDESRQDESRWPEWQLFWEQHPVAEWLNDRVLGSFERHEAPILRVDKGLEAGQRVVVFQGVISNHRSQPAVIEWFGVRFDSGHSVDIASLTDLINETGLQGDIANPGTGVADELSEELAHLLKPAVGHAERHMEELRAHRAGERAEPLREGMRKLKRWYDKSLEDLQKWESARLARGMRKDERERFARRKTYIEKTYEERQLFVDEAMKTVREPYLRVAAVLIPLER